MTVKVLAFARYREILGFEALEVSLSEASTLEDLLGHPRLAKLPQDALLAVNKAFASRESPLVDGDEVALMPPVSGG